MPVNSERGYAAAIGTRLPPSPQPISRTRAFAGSNVSIPTSAATVAMRAGWQFGHGRPTKSIAS
jgi:hypothetical protein